MTSGKISYIHQIAIPKIVSEQIQQYDPTYDHESMIKVLNLTSQQSFYSRAGDNTLPFLFNCDFVDYRIPAVDINFSKTFEEVTDQRCQELLTTHNDRPWIVSWSGGIDSTVILVSLLKHASKSRLDTITVACNNLSIIENPVFFYNHVVPNFKIINSTDPNFENFLQTHYVIDGNPADLLQGSGLGLQAQLSGLNLQSPWQNQTGPLIDFLTNLIGRKSAEWFYNRISANINSLDGPTQLVDTLSDWFWWVNFNWKWMTDNWFTLSYQDLPNLKSCFVSFKNWYDTADYQQWSIKRGRYSLINDGISLGDYKKPSKQYIYEYDGNQYYHRFKIKTHSTARTRPHKPWVCMLDDGTVLTAEQDLDLILELLPTHLNV
jgi:hypothetical protein